MPADYSIASLDAIQAGAAAADTLENIANTARNAACSFFKLYPSVVIPNPAFDFLDATWDGLCKNSAPGLPPAPAPPFTGGQCVCFLYQVNIGYTYDRGDGTTVVTVPPANTVQVWGPISSFELGKTSGAFPYNNAVFVTCRGAGFGACNTTSSQVQAVSVPFGSPPGRILTYSASVSPVSGSDTCGNLPPVYPPPTTPPTPVPPTTNVYNLPSVSLTFNNGLTFNIAPTLNLDNTWGPTLNIGNLNISVGGGGVTISPPPASNGPSLNISNNNVLNNLTNNVNNVNNNVTNANTNITNTNTNVTNTNNNVNNVNNNLLTLTPTINNTLSNTNTINTNVNNLTTQLGATNTTVSTINSTVNTINSTTNIINTNVGKINKQTKPVPKPTDTGILTITVPAGTYTVTGLTNLISAQVILTTLPTKSEIRFGADPTYNVYVAGFFAWLQQGEAIQRIPLQYVNNINFAPKGCDGYSYTLVNGAQGYSIYSEDNS
jgi:archaellum component FlaC